MRAIKLSAILLVLALAMICFVAVPVFSGETDGHPWDADDSGSKDVDNDNPIDPDTTTTVIFRNTSVPDEPEDESFVDGVVSQVVFFIVNTIYNYQPETYFIIAPLVGNSSEETATSSQ